MTEDTGIVQETADLIGKTTVFGEGSQLAFRNTGKAVGSYSELYQRALGSLLVRPTINTINTGETRSYIPFDHVHEKPTTALGLDDSKPYQQEPAQLHYTGK